MRFSVYSDSDSGWYGWFLTDGPDDAYVKGGIAPTITQCLTKITLARAEIARYVARDSNAMSPRSAHHTLDPELGHSPHAHRLPLQQDIPSRHQLEIDFSHCAPSKSG